MRSTFMQQQSYRPHDQERSCTQAKEVGKKLSAYDEQLGDYFAKDPNVKLGILTSGAQWRFFTDIVNSNVMDKEPFARWDILADEPPPYDVLTILQKSQFNPELIRAYAQRQRAQNLLLSELTRLLEPSAEFTKLAVANIETRNLTAAVVESWKPIVANAVSEWAKQRMLSSVLAPQPSAAAATSTVEAAKVVTTAEELEAFETIKKLLGPDHAVAYEDSVAYFKIHLVERRTWVCIRLQLDRKTPLIWVPMAQDVVAPLAKSFSVKDSGHQGWTTVALESLSQISELSDLFHAAYDTVKQAKSGDKSND